MAEWHCHIQGQQYGPIDEQVLQNWFKQNRITLNDMVWKEGMAEWQPLGQAPGMEHLALGEMGPVPPAFDAPAPPAHASESSRYARAHRGAAVLVLGILSIVICPLIFGLIAVSMGKRDLAEMDAGLMDNSGRGLTKAGTICGIIGLCLGVMQLMWVFGTCATTRAW